VCINQPLHRRVVPATYAQLLYEYVEVQGVAPEQVLLRPWPTPDPSGLGGVDVDEWQALLERAALALNEPLISIKLAKQVSVRHLGVLGAVLLASENLGSALARFEHFQRLIFDVQPMVTTLGPHFCDIGWALDDRMTGPLVEQAGYAVLLEFSRSMARGVVNPLEVRFASAEPPHAQGLRKYFACPVLFNSASPGVRFDRKLLELPVKGKDPLMVEVLTQHANRLLDQLPKQEGIVQAVRREIAKALQEGEPKAELICTALHCSHRTLLRKLAQAGTNFRSELNLVRQELATSYLQDPRLRIVDVALLLGYSDHSAFTRAYKEWTGVAPVVDRGQGAGPPRLNGSSQH